MQHPKQLRSTSGKKRLCAGALAIMLSAMLAFPAQALAYIDETLDQTPLTDEEIQEAIENGEIETEIDTDTDTDTSYIEESSTISTYSISALASTYSAITLTSATTTSTTTSDYAVTTIGGSNRYETSALQALSAFTSSEYAIVASGVGYADSIAAAGLAGALECPILLTNVSEVPEVIVDALEELDVQYIILLGSETVADATVLSALESIVGSGNVERVWGADRYATQMAIYEYGVEHDLWNSDYIVVAAATDFADALSMSPISYKMGAPVFFIDSSKTLPAAQQAVLDSGVFDGKTFLLAGDEKVTSAAAEKYLSTIGTVVRLAGSDRYKTSQAIATYAVENLGMTWDGVAFTSGKAPYDALGGGVIQGKANSVLLLANEDTSATTTAISLPFTSGSISSMKFFGDDAIYSNAYKTRCAITAGFSLSQIEGFVLYLDAGHGPNSSGDGLLDGGASGNGYTEYALNVELVNLIAEYLKTYGISVYTNTDGGYYKLRQAEAYELGCGAFVSIHFNSGGGTGTETYIHSKNAATTSDILQDWIHSDLVAALGRTDRGQQTAAFAVLSGNLPATLLEIAFIDNATDMKTYQANKEKVAQAIAYSIAYG